MYEFWPLLGIDCTYMLKNNMLGKQLATKRKTRCDLGINNPNNNINKNNNNINNINNNLNNIMNNNIINNNNYNINIILFMIKISIIITLVL